VEGANQEPTDAAKALEDAEAALAEAKEGLDRAVRLLESADRDAEKAQENLEHSKGLARWYQRAGADRQRAKRLREAQAANDVYQAALAARDAARERAEAAPGGVERASRDAAAAHQQAEEARNDAAAKVAALDQANAAADDYAEKFKECINETIAHAAQRADEAADRAAAARAEVPPGVDPETAAAAAKRARAAADAATQAETDMNRAIQLAHDGGLGHVGEEEHHELIADLRKAKADADYTEGVAREEQKRETEREQTAARKQEDRQHQEEMRHQAAARAAAARAQAEAEQEKEREDRCHHRGHGAKRRTVEDYDAPILKFTTPYNAEPGDLKHALSEIFKSLNATGSMSTLSQGIIYFLRGGTAQYMNAMWDVRKVTIRTYRTSCCEEPREDLELLSEKVEYRLRKVQAYTTESIGLVDGLPGELRAALRILALTNKAQLWLAKRK
jgi:hypothetical protein